MGYYTKYEMESVTPKLTREQYLEVLEFLSQKIIGESAKVGDNINDYLQEPMKWYDSDKDMLELSAKFPNNLFLLSGYGEEQDDIWKAYFKNNKVFYPKRTVLWEDFDENKLT